MNEVISTINEITNNIKPIAIPLAGLVLVVIGLLWMFAKDAQKKDMYVGWFINVMVGFAIVYLGASIISWFSGKVSTF